MDRPYFFLKSVGGNLYLECGEGDRTLRDRPIQPDEPKGFEAWIRAYRRALFKPDPAEDLLSLGREIVQWLDRHDNSFSRLKEHRSVPFIVEFRVPRDPTDPMLRFLEVPWELAADHKGHLAGDGHVLYCPVRRIGEPMVPDPCGDYRLSLTFMAASPASPSVSQAQPLRFEDEERAVFQATGNLGMDLTVEESGTLRGLAETLSRASDPFVLHVSCHGAIRDGQPVLILETDEGDPHFAGPEAFNGGLGQVGPRLFFASACRTGDKVMNSFACDLVRRGLPAVLGWSGTVQDAEATRFAEKLYGSLSRKHDLETSTAYARHGLLSPEAQAREAPPSRDWHLARVYLGPKGGGPVCGGDRMARPGGADSGVKEFLDTQRRIPVAGRWEFVGRRREIQKVLKALQGDEYAGVLIHGLGRQGKSSLAARVANRLHGLYGHRTTVVFGRYDAPAVLSAVAEAFPTTPVADIATRYRDSVNDDPEALERALHEILTGPCRDRAQGDGREPAPMLLIIDDFEQALLTETPFPHPVHPDYRETIRSVIRAFKRAGSGTRSGLIFTSRYTFQLKPHGEKDLAEALFPLSLNPMEAHDGLKQMEAKSRVAGVAPETLKPAVTERIVSAARGNPGLQDLLFRMFLQAQKEHGPHAEESADTFRVLNDTLEAMEAFLQGGAPPRAGELQEFLENLAVDRMLGLLGEGETELLRASTLFQLPVPVKVLETVARECGYAAGEPTGVRIFGLGLWSRFEDPVDRREIAAAVHPLVTGRLRPLPHDHIRTLASRVVGPLFRAWGGRDGSRRPPAADWELARLALAAESAEVAAHTAADAIGFLESRFQHRQASAFAVDCLALLEKSGTEGTADFYHQAGRILQATGHIPQAADCVERALALSGAPDEKAKTGENVKYASILLTRGRLKQQQGELDEAEKSFTDAERRLDAVDAQRERLIALGETAHIKVSKGEVDDALKLHQQELEVYEALGDRRERAVTLGDIARIKVSKGEVDDALKLHEERLEVFQELGDRRERAVTLGDIARIKVSKGEVDDALKLHEEMLEVFQELGDRRSRAVTLGDIARIKVDKGEVDDALKLHEERLEVFQELGDRRSRAVTLGDIARIKVDKGEVDDALKLHEERLEVFQELGDLSEVAHTLWSMARVDAARGEYQKAYERLSESYRINMKLGRLDGICFVGLDLGPILCGGGHREQGLEILQRSRDGFLRLGRRDLAEHAAQWMGRFGG